MILATPAAMLAAISSLARRGILVKGGVHLERLARVDCIAFDKTGTLTLGRPELVEVVTFNSHGEAELLSWAAGLESHSEHLLARAIRAAAEERGLPSAPVEAVQRHTGLGLQGSVKLHRGVPLEIAVGSARFLRQHGIELDAEQQKRLQTAAEEGAVAVLLACDNAPAGALIFRDTPRPEAARAVHRLQHLGIRKTVLLTGDNPSSAQRVARAVGISDFYGDLLPQEKLARLQEMKHQGFSVAMVGDGVNDSPSLAAADVGIAMGDTGTDIAAEAAGVVLIGEGGLDRIAELIRTSRRAVKTIQDNILWFGFVVNLSAVLAAFAGYLSPVVAAVVHQCSSFLVLMNSLRLLGPETPLFVSRLRRRLEIIRNSSAPALFRWFSFFTTEAQRARRDWRKVLPSAAALAGALWLLSGVAIISPDETGIVQRFGRVLDRPLAPGPHWLLPWPVERLHRVRTARVNSIEIGFRIVQGDGENAEPAAYEWNIQHRQGRYLRQPEEALLLTGDEYLVEVNAIAQYSVMDPRLFLFKADNLPEMLRAICERALRHVVGFMTLDQVLALDRSGVERVSASLAAEEILRLGLGVRLLSFNLQDVHPALEVVGSFRDVGSALEEKNRMINEAQAYANERVPLARGEGRKRVIEADTYRLRRVARGTGEAERFNLEYDAYRSAPQATRTRLYLETVEVALADKVKYILDQKSGRRKMLLLRDSVFNFGDLEKAVKK